MTLQERWHLHTTVSETLHDRFTRLCNRRAISVNRMLMKMISDEVLNDEMAPAGFPIARTNHGITIAEIKREAK